MLIGRYMDICHGRNRRGFIECFGMEDEAVKTNLSADR
jgi:hypothetical protein